MQTLLLPAARSGVAPPAPPYSVAVSRSIPCNASRPSLRFNASPYPHSSLSSLKFLQSLSSPFIILNNQSNRSVNAPASAPIAAAYSSPADESEKAKLAQVSISPFLWVIVWLQSLCWLEFGARVFGILWVENRLFEWYDLNLGFRVLFSLGGTLVIIAFNNWDSEIWLGFYPFYFLSQSDNYWRAV